MPIRLSILIVLLSSCTNQATKPSSEKKAVYSEVREPDDSARFTYIKYDLYQTNAGHLCERKLAFKNDSTTRFEVYYDSLYALYTGDTILYTPLDSVIDITSFTNIESTWYSKDKLHVYYFHPNSDGGIRLILEEADPTSFKRLCEYRWGVDQNHVFYEGSPLSGINLLQLQILPPPDTTDHFIQYVKDDTHVYFTNILIPEADAKTFKVISNKAWDAEDQYRRYEAGVGHLIKP